MKCALCHDGGDAVLQWYGIALCESCFDKTVSHLPNCEVCGEPWMVGCGVRFLTARRDNGMSVVCAKCTEEIIK